MSYIAHGFATLMQLNNGAVRATASAARFTTPGVKKVFNNLGSHRYRIEVSGRISNGNVQAHIYVGTNATLVYDTSASLISTSDRTLTYIFDNTMATYSQLSVGVLMNKPPANTSISINFIKMTAIAETLAPEPTTNLLASVYKSKINAVVNIFGVSTVGQGYYGSGFFVSADGYIVTAGHVAVSGTTVPEPYARNIYVQIYPENTVVTAVIVGVDRKYDVAVLKVPVTGRTFLQWADSRNANIGSVVAAIGAPMGAHVQNVTMGVISDNKCQDYSWMPESITSDVSIIGGNSGGPLLTDVGTVIGIVSWAIINDSYELSGAISSNVARLIADSIIARHKQGDTGALDFPSSYLGVEFSPVDIYTAVSRGLARVEGVRITAVAPGSSAAAGGLQVGDVVLAVNGHSVGRNNSQEPFGTIIHFAPAGSPLNMTVNRAGRSINLAPRVVAMPPTQDVLFANKQTLQKLVEGTETAFC